MTGGDKKVVQMWQIEAVEDGGGGKDSNVKAVVPCDSSGIRDADLGEPGTPDVSARVARAARDAD